MSLVRADLSQKSHILTRVEFIGNHCEDLGFSRKSYKIMGTILLFYYKSRSYIIQCSCTYGKTWCFVGDTELFSCKFDLRWESTLIDIWPIYLRLLLLIQELECTTKLPPVNVSQQDNSRHVFDCEEWQWQHRLCYATCSSYLPKWFSFYT